jgi:hypothetical protein
VFGVSKTLACVLVVIAKLKYTTHKLYIALGKLHTTALQTRFRPVSHIKKGLTRNVNYIDSMSFNNLSGLLYSCQIYTTGHIKGDIIGDLFPDQNT